MEVSLSPGSLIPERREQLLCLQGWMGSGLGPSGQRRSFGHLCLCSCFWQLLLQENIGRGSTSTSSLGPEPAQQGKWRGLGLGEAPSADA